ncbi:MAG TPA: serine hydrolase, partial [Chloroflexota bacterium]|nr:serine hydrolase [Chloroflexota bacterium]
AVRNLKTGETASLNAEEFFPSASLYKLAVMYEVFRQKQIGQLSTDEVLTIQPSQMKEANEDDSLSVGDNLTIQQALESMIGQSNNVAAFALAERVGWEQINQSMGALGLNYTRIPAGTWKTQVSDWRSTESSTSPADMLTFFQALYSHKLISPEASDAMLKLLLDQRVNDRIPSNLPAGTAVAHKTGNLPSIVNDAGIVYGPHADFIVVFLTHDVDESFATTAEARLARRLYDVVN